MFRKLLSLLIALAPMLVLGSTGQVIRVQVKGAEGDTLYLASYYGNKLFYADTALADDQGKAVFEAPDGRPAGIYAVVVPGPKYFELVLNEPEVDVRTTMDDLVGDLEVVRSAENKRFIDYIRYLNEQKEKGASLRTRAEQERDPIRRATFEQQLKDLDRGVRSYQQELIDKDPDALVARVVRMSIPVDPPQPLLPDGRVDSVGAYYAYRDHFWDHTDLTDPRIVRTPVFANKVEEYFSKLVPQVPDTINALTDRLVARLGDDRELFRYVVHHVTYTYETSDIMGMDAVFVHMALTYYCPRPDGKSRAWWMTDEKLDKLCERATKMAPLVIGAQAMPLILPDTSEARWVASHPLPEEFVVLCFWDPHCGHCKKELPELHRIYKERLQGLNAEVYAVAKATDSVLFADWKEFIREKDLDWVNVGLTHHVYEEAKKDPSKYIPRYTTLASLNYADTYDVFSTPKVFVLDKDRRIVGKQLSPEQIADLIERLWKRNHEGDGAGH